MKISISNSDGTVDVVRVKRPVRDQVEWRPMALDQLVPDDHRVRAVWAFVDSLDFRPLYRKFKALAGGPGRDGTDPKILLALWMYATIEGIGSARHLARLCERDLIYMWMCGGVGVNHDMLSEFRVAHGAFLDRLLTDTIATLLHQKIVTLETIAQDGMRVRAHAGGASFRREKTLNQCRQQAAAQVQRLREEAAESDPNAGNRRREAARERAARERLERVDAALENLAELREQKEKRKKGSGDEARCSTTDPEARNMKMADGGYRPAYNVQFATDGDARMIVSVDVGNNGSDGGQMAPLYDDVCRRYGRKPDAYLVDGGFATNEDITHVEQTGTPVYAPMTHDDRIRRRGGDPHDRRAGDTDAMYAFRQRMKTEEAKATYERRPSIAEFPNAECRNRGLRQFVVRGLAKVKTVSLLYALSFNFLRMLHLEAL
jgi:transposase